MATSLRLTLLWRVLAIWVSSITLLGLALVVGRTLPGGGQLAYSSEWLGSMDIYLTDLGRQVEFHLSPGGIPLWSPDGRYLVYTAGSRANQNIYLMDANARRLSNLTADSPHDQGPAWSPDGKQLAFESTRDGDWEIYVIDICDGCPTNPRRLTHSPGLDASPSWSPDGTQLAFLSTRTGESEIYVMDVNGTVARRLTRHSRTDLQPPRWSPDGTQLAFVSMRAGNWDVYVMDSVCGNLPEGCEGHLLNLSLHPAQDQYPVWSPDGTHIAFTSRRDGDFEIYVVPSVGGDARNLTNDPAEDTLPSWSPDGSQIAFQSNRDRLYSDDIYVVDVAQAVTRRLTYTYGSNQYPAWWPR
jgi:Tol biopolymer transport system component